MKKTLFITMLAAALVGSQAFAADPIPTTTDAEDRGDGIYAGAYSETADVSRANVTINEEPEGGDDFSGSRVYGGYTGGEQATASNNSVTMTGGQVANVVGGNSSSGEASDNKVTMTGGQVSTLTGGNGTTSASGNTAIMTGGSVGSMYGGKSVKDASGNIAIVAGDSVVSSVLGGGFILMGGDAANDNKIYLVGKGATATIADAQGNKATYTGGAISLNIVSGGRCSVSAGNSIDFYGTGITVSYSVQDMQILNFHIADGLRLSQEAMVSLTLQGLDLTGVNLGFYNDDVQDWSAFDGKSITLVNAAQAITVGEGSMGEVEIKGADGATVATATLALGNENKSLVLGNIKGTTPVPEPTTGTLSLLALAGLCIRRRRK